MIEEERRLTKQRWDDKERAKSSNGWGTDMPFVRNPRNPSNLSFEKCQFLLDDETMTRLRNAALEGSNNNFTCSEYFTG